MSPRPPSKMDMSVRSSGLLALAADVARHGPDMSARKFGQRAEYGLPNRIDLRHYAELMDAAMG